MKRSEGLEERFVECLERMPLKCGCGETLILLGLEEDWNLEGRTDFECGHSRGKYPSRHTTSRPRTPMRIANQTVASRTTNVKATESPPRG
jgi:hypothetical protein